MDLTWVKTIEILMVVKFLLHLVDKQVKFQILSYKLGVGKSLTGLGLKKFKKPGLGRIKKIISKLVHMVGFLFPSTV
jgi:hypothetical protein